MPPPLYQRRPPYPGGPYHWYWRAGYWFWNGRRWKWRAGRWAY
jgi:hypothetical protein